MQIFIDDNKRASIIFANRYLIAHGQGFSVIPEEHGETSADDLHNVCALWAVRCFIKGCIYFSSSLKNLKLSIG